MCKQEGKQINTLKETIPCRLTICTSFISALSNGNQCVRSYHHDGTHCIWRMQSVSFPESGSVQIMINCCLKNSDCIMADNMIDLMLPAYLGSPATAATIPLSVSNAWR